MLTAEKNHDYACMYLFHIIGQVLLGSLKCNESILHSGYIDEINNIETRKLLHLHMP